jgi:hypothetical protein
VAEKIVHCTDSGMYLNTIQRMVRRNNNSSKQ